MAMLITETCINCGNCEPDCPNTAISQGANIYQIDSAKCTECVEVCPVDGCITVDPAHTESREVLEARYHSLHG